MEFVNPTHGEDARSSAVRALTRKQKRDAERRDNLDARIESMRVELDREEAERAQQVARRLVDDDVDRALAPPRRSTRAEATELQKRVARRFADGLCVWNALLTGVASLMPRGQPSHEAMLRHIQQRLHDERAAAAVAAVRFNGEPLSAQLVREVLEAVSTVHVADGYFCCAQDPLLIAVAAILRVVVIHTLLGQAFVFAVERPVRVIRLESDAGHMRFVSCE